MRNKLMLVVALVGLALVITDATAGPTQSDVAVTADGGVRITTKIGSPVGPSLFDMACDGSAWAKFIWFQENLVTGTGAGSRADSTSIVLKVVVQLRDYTPPRSLYFPSGPDSVYIDLVTATEVIITR